MHRLFSTMIRETVYAIWVTGLFAGLNVVEWALTNEIDLPHMKQGLFYLWIIVGLISLIRMLRAIKATPTETAS